MSDQSNLDPTETGPAFGARPPQPPPMAPPPGAFGDAPTTVVELPPEASVAGRATKAPGRLAVLATGGVMLVGGTAFALSSAGGGGPETPEQAAAALFEAIANEDAVGVLGALDPAERDAVREPMQQMVSELERLEVLDESFDLGSVSGFDFEFDGLTFDVEQVRPDLARVHITAGEASVAVDGDQIAVGGFVTDVLDEFGGDMSELTTSSSSGIDTTDSGGFFVARDTGDGWRISLGYTAAEAARDALGAPVPDAGDGIAPRGADSPTEAVDGMIRSAAAFDFEDVIARMSSEMHPLREYADLYAAELADAEREASSEVRVDVGDIRLEADESGSTALVTVEGFDLSIEADGSRFDIEVDGDCVTVSGDLDDLDLDGSPFEAGQVCADDLDELSRDGLGDLEAELADEGIRLPEFGPLNPVEFGIIAVREDGEWFVSPVRTFMDVGVKGLQALNREHLDAGVDFVESLIDSFESEFSSSFDDEFTTTFVDDFDTDDDFIDVTELPDLPELPKVPEVPPFDDDFEFELPETFEEQMEFIFGEDAACIIAEVDLLDPQLRDDIRNTSANGQLDFEAGEALGEVLERCGAFGP